MFERVQGFVTRLLPDGDVASQIVKSGIWAAMSNFLSRGLQFVKLLALTWLLTPTDIGLVTYATLALVAVRRISTLGINEALIEKSATDVDEYLNVAWTLRVVRGVVLLAALYVAAPFIARFFVSNRVGLVTNFVRVIGLVSLFKGLENPAIVYFRKNLDFHREFAYRVGRAATIFVVSIGIAWVFRSPWAIVLGEVAGGFVAVVISYLIQRYRPRPAFDRETAGDLLGYGKWITASGLVVYLINNGDDVFVGWFIGPAALALYQTAYQISNTPATEITHVVSSVVFPAYSKLQEDAYALRDAYYKSVGVTTFLSFPTAVGIVAVAPTFAYTFLNDQWASSEVVLVLQVLAMWGLLRSLGATTGPLFQALGHPDYATKIQVGKLLIIAITIYPATQAFGIVGTGGVIVLNSVLFSEPIASLLALRLVDGDLRSFLGLIGYPAIASTIMGLGVFGVRKSFELQQGVLPFLSLVGVGTVIYAAAILACDRWFGYEILDTLTAMQQRI